MPVHLRPKTYGPLQVQSADADNLQITTEAGFVAAGSRTPQADGLSPSDLLLASLGTCIAISMRMAAQQMQLALGELTLTSHATKALDPPNRFSLLQVEVDLALALTTEQAEELIRRTKALCTISNTLGAAVELKLKTGSSALPAAVG